jgi:hypothetical protein
MTLLVLERKFDPPLTSQDVVDMARAGAWCFQQYRVAWRGSLLAVDGRTMVCQFESGDAESIRQVLRVLDADMSVLWPATLHEVADPGDPNVIVERSFDEPCELGELQAKEDSKRWCLETHNVSFVRTLFSLDRKRMLCLYAGPDAEAVRAAQREAGMPFDRVWSFQSLGLADLAS